MIFANRRTDKQTPAVPEAPSLAGVINIKKYG